jgi:hypothetical protein
MGGNLGDKTMQHDAYLERLEERMRVWHGPAIAEEVREATTELFHARARFERAVRPIGTTYTNLLRILTGEAQ